MDFRKSIIVERIKIRHTGEIPLESSPKNTQEELTQAQKIPRVFVVLFKTLMSFISRMHIAGLIKSVSRALERTLRGVTSTLLKNALRSPILSIDGIKYWLSDTRLESLLTLSPEYEKYVWSYFKPAVGNVFIDVGAHVGKYTLQVAKIVQNHGTVIALEPHVGNFQALLKGIHLNGFQNIIPVNVAAWNKECKLQLFIGDASTYHSTKINRGLGYVTVQAQTIDQIVATLHIKHVDWIKVDAEEAEIEVTMGLKKTLSAYNPQLIVEVQWKNLKKFLSLMENYHYKVKPIEGEQNPRDMFGYFYCSPLPT